MTLSIPAFHVPGSTQRLLSPQTIFNLNVASTFVVSHSLCQLLFCDHLALTIPLDPTNGLSTSIALCPTSLLPPTASLNICLTDAQNQNLTKGQKEYLCWHFCLGYLHSDVIQFLLRQPSFFAVLTNMFRISLHPSLVCHM
jgi:hypothetical protein